MPTKGSQRTGWEELLLRMRGVSVAVAVLVPHFSSLSLRTPPCPRNPTNCNPAAAELRL